MLSSTRRRCSRAKPGWTRWSTALGGWTHLPHGRTWQNLVWLVFERMTFGGFGLLAGPPGGTRCCFLGVWRRGRRFYRVGHFCAGQQPESAVQPQGLRTERRLLGFHVAWHQVPLQ